MKNVGMNEIINTVRKRPAMYIGCNELTPMKHFLDGCYTYRIAAECPSESIIPLDYRYFRDFMRIKAGGSRDDGLWNAEGWTGYIINDLCGGDERTALEKFFGFYDEFSAVKITGCKKAVLSEENIKMAKSRRYYGMHNGTAGEHPFFDSPVNVYVVKLSIPAYMVLVEQKDDIMLPHGLSYSAETLIIKHFGKIGAWEELDGDHFGFEDKPVSVNCFF